MKTYLKILTVFLVMMSCQSTKKEDGNSLSSTAKNEKTYKKENVELSKDIQDRTTLTKAQFTNFFPTEIDGYKLINVSVLMSSALASALYVKNNDYGHSMTYSIEDSARKGAAAIENFNDAYSVKPQGPKGTAYIYTERGGYKTIAFLQPQIKRNDIRFIYNNRYRITLEGIADVDTLWGYLKTEDLKKLDTLSLSFN